MFTYEQYIAKECTHREYYAQFAPIFKRTVANKFDVVYLQEKLAEDRYLNNIPLSYWDRLSEIYKHAFSIKNETINGSYGWSLSDGVCAAKEAAIQIAEDDHD